MLPQHELLHTHKNEGSSFASLCSRTLLGHTELLTVRPHTEYYDSYDTEIPRDEESLLLCQDLTYSESHSHTYYPVQKNPLQMPTMWQSVKNALTLPHL